MARSIADNEDHQCKEPADLRRGLPTRLAGKRDLQFTKLVARSRPPFEVITAAVLLALFGLLGNYTHISLFFGIDFLFGGVAVLLALSLLGIGAGVIVGAIASTYTYILWSHPYAILIFTIEAIVVGFLSQKRCWSLTSSEAAYWSTIGIPLVLYCYHIRLSLPLLSAWTIALKQASNGLFCAFLVSALLLSPIVKSWSAPNHRLRMRRLKDIVVELSIAFTFFAMLFSASLDSNLARQQAEANMYQQLRSVSDSILAQVSAWKVRDGQDTQLLADLIHAHDYPMDLTIVLDLNDPTIRIEHHSGVPVESLQEFSQVDYIYDRLDRYFPVGDLPALKRWRDSIYQWNVPATPRQPWGLTITASAAPEIDRLEMLYSQQLFRLLVVTGIVLIVANLSMRAIARPLALLDPERKPRSIVDVLKQVMGKTVRETSEKSPIASLESDELNSDSRSLCEPLVSSRVLEFRMMGHYLQKVLSKRAAAIEQLQLENRQLHAALQEADTARIEQGNEAVVLRQALIENHQRLDGFVKNTPIVALEWAEDGKICAWNPAACERLGYMEGEAIGHSLFETILSLEERTVLLDTWRKSVEVSGPYRSSHLTVTKDGEQLNFDWFSRPIVAQTGEIVTMLSVLIEVRERSGEEQTRHAPIEPPPDLS